MHESCSELQANHLTPQSLLGSAASSISQTRDPANAPYLCAGKGRGGRVWDRETAVRVQSWLRFPVLAAKYRIFHIRSWISTQSEALFPAPQLPLTEHAQLALVSLVIWLRNVQASATSYWGNSVKSPSSLYRAFPLSKRGDWYRTMLGSGGAV